MKKKHEHAIKRLEEVAKSFKGSISFEAEKRFPRYHLVSQWKENLKDVKEDRERSEKKKDIDYYMKLKYKIVVISIPIYLGGGFNASIPQLGSCAFIGDGETEEEALRDLEETKREYFEDYLEKGIKIPEPEEKY